MKKFFKDVVKYEKIYLEKVAETIKDKNDRTEILFALIFVGVGLVEAKAYPKYFKACIEDALKQPKDGEEPVE